MKPIHIFRAGQHTANDGTTLSFDEGILQDLVASYDPALHEAPITVGHPQDNAPAYGWIKSLRLAESDVEADPHQVDPAFAEMVAAGRFKKRSASLYSPDAPHNPKPGHWYLRHVGFLGAQPPAIKGLRDYAFADKEEGVVEFMDQGDAGMLATLFRRLREGWIAKFGVDEADKVLPDWTIQDLEHAARTSDKSQDLIPGFSESDPPPGDEDMTPEQKAALEAREKAIADQEAAIKAKEDAIAAKEKDFAEQARKADAAAVSARVDGLVKDGKLTPAQRDKMVMLATMVSPTAEFEFSEGDKTTKVQAREVLFGLVAELPKKLEFGERRMDPAAGDPGAVDPVKLAAKIQEFRTKKAEAGVVVSYSEAARAVMAGE